ncbi:alpha/beta fold hydrolase [Natronomonas sp.]|uniref:alpha/beta fold hydrolase n=1 Tax=Natronomonas sp. TaxID=2184060 RepID=UPI002FC2F47F
MRTSHQSDGEELLFVMGWGNRVDGTNERWFATQLANEGYRVTLVELPTNPRDFEAEYLDPVADLWRELGEPLVVGHSTGGLVAAHLRPERAVYVSPWWAFHGEKHRERILRWGSKLPLSRPFVPIDFDREEIGPRVTDRGWSRIPDYVSPVFIREIRGRTGVASRDIRPCAGLLFAPGYRRGTAGHRRTSALRAGPPLRRRPRAVRGGRPRGRDRRRSRRYRGSYRVTIADDFGNERARE